jgi:uncharacterized phage protein (TIGR02220 family)
MNHSFDTDIAELIGLKESILLQHLGFWHQKNVGNNHNFYLNRYWSKLSVAAWQNTFPYLSIKEIRGALTRMEDAGYISSMKFNQTDYDRTLWYGLTESGYELLGLKCGFTKGQMHLPKGQMEDTQRANGSGQKGKCIIGTDNNTDIKTDIIKASKKLDPLAEPMIDQVIEAWNKITGQDIQKTTLTHRKNISARLKENPALTLPDFELVIAGKFKEWNKEPETGRSDTRAWITTNTILGSKFDGYLNSLRMLQKRQVEIDRRAQEDVVPLAEDLMARAGWKP